MIAPDAVELPAAGTGVLVPSGTVLGDEVALTTAVSFLDRKWPHLARQGEVLLRASVGRIDDVRFMSLEDAAITERVRVELGVILGHDVELRASDVTRWESSFPQYRVNHLVRVEGIESAIGALGGLAVGGAAYRGVGIPACIASGRQAARAVRTWLSDQS
jgi:oxygen-dependent protoporphyrinogen oxidase